MPNTYVFRATDIVTAKPERPIEGIVLLEGGAEFHGPVAAGTIFSRVPTGAIQMHNGADVSSFTNNASLQAANVVVHCGELGLVTMDRIGSTITFTEARNDVHIVAPADEVATIGDAAAAAPVDLA